jgi:uncharacterized protein YbjT (DUF2867 family)
MEAVMNTLSSRNEPAKPVLILGGNGKTGRRVAERLTAHGTAIRIGSRSGQPPFDWQDDATWEPVLQGVEAIGAFSRLAVGNGVRRLVLLSGRGEVEAQRAEQELQASGADWTILRAAWFSQNFSENFLLDGVLAGEIALPVGDVGEPFMDADDIADVAVAVLTQHGHNGQLYELTGPRLLTFAEVTEEIAKASGRSIRYVQVSAEDYAAALTQMELPSEIAALLMELFTQVLDGRNAYLGDGVERALGRKPRDFIDYARATAATGVWGAGK